VNDAEEPNREIDRARLLQWLEDLLELPMVVLGLAWLVLLIIDLVRGLVPILTLFSTIIWIVFILEFLLEFTIAPRKAAYLRQNWLTVIALLVPALRIFRLFRVLQVLRAARGARLVSMLGSLNRGMRALAASLGRHGFSYAAALTLVVIFTGAAGMYAFERNPPAGHGLARYPEAPW